MRRREKHAGLRLLDGERIKTDTGNYGPGWYQAVRIFLCPETLSKKYEPI